MEEILPAEGIGRVMAEPPEKKVAKKAGAKKAPSAKNTVPTKKAAAGATKAATKKAPSSKRAAKTPTDAEIAARAYEIHEREGGDHEENWLRAERELKGA
jgi:Protein of unknown function (DUF2934)